MFQGLEGRQNLGRLELHRFHTAQKRNDESALGTELDLVGRWKFAKPGNLELGIGVFVPEELATILLPAFANGEDTTWWGYAQFILSWPRWSSRGGRKF